MGGREARAAMAEWLRRWTRNPMGSSRTGSNPVRSVKIVLLQGGCFLVVTWVKEWVGLQSRYVS